MTILIKLKNVRVGFQVFKQSEFKYWLVLKRSSAFRMLVINIVTLYINVYNLRELL
jgi:hypothetical protein